MSEMASEPQTTERLRNLHPCGDIEVPMVWPFPLEPGEEFDCPIEYVKLLVKSGNFEYADPEVAAAAEDAEAQEVADIDAARVKAYEDSLAEAQPEAEAPATSPEVVPVTPPPTPPVVVPDPPASDAPVVPPAPSTPADAAETTDETPKA